MSEDFIRSEEGHNSKVKSKKKYYKIAEASILLGVKPHVLRYWETEFPQIRPCKTKSGQRLYRRRDFEALRHIHRLLYQERCTIAGARQALREIFANENQQPQPKSVSDVLQAQTEATLIEDSRHNGHRVKEQIEVEEDAPEQDLLLTEAVQLSADLREEEMQPRLEVKVPLEIQAEPEPEPVKLDLQSEETTELMLDADPAPPPSAEENIFIDPRESLNESVKESEGLMRQSEEIERPALEEEPNEKHSELLNELPVYPSVAQAALSKKPEKPDVLEIVEEKFVHTQLRESLLKAKGELESMLLALHA